MNDNQSVEAPDEAKVVVRKGEAEMLNFHMPVGWFVDGAGKVWVDAVTLAGIIVSVSETNGSFAKSQSKQMAPQASYDIGRAAASRDIVNLLYHLLNEAEKTTEKISEPGIRAAIEASR